MLGTEAPAALTPHPWKIIGFSIVSISDLVGRFMISF